VHLRVEQTDTPFTAAATVGQILKIPIGHGEGNYFAPPDMLARLEANRQVILRYTDPQGRVDELWNPNGSVNAIAALCNEARNVVGMMPHPERACETLLGGVDGRIIFDSILETFRSAERIAAQWVGVGNASNAVLRSASLSGERSR
jgi:phosphoribosylformylglycinamidine synthase